MHVLWLTMFVASPVFCYALLGVVDPPSFAASFAMFGERRPLLFLAALGPATPRRSNRSLRCLLCRCLPRAELPHRVSHPLHEKHFLPGSLSPSSLCVVMTANRVPICVPGTILPYAQKPMIFVRSLTVPPPRRQSTKAPWLLMGLKLQAERPDNTYWKKVLLFCAINLDLRLNCPLSRTQVVCPLLPALLKNHADLAVSTCSRRRGKKLHAS